MEILRKSWIVVVFVFCSWVSIRFGFYNLIPITLLAAKANFVVNAFLFCIYLLFTFFLYCGLESKFDKLWKSRAEVAKNISAFFDSANKCPGCGGNNTINIEESLSSMSIDNGGGIRLPNRVCGDCGEIFR